MAKNPRQPQTSPTTATPAPTASISTTATTSTLATATSTAGTGAMIGDVPPTGGGTGTGGENVHPAAPENRVGADQQPAAPANWDQVNEAWCDLNRLGKAVDSMAIVAGRELAAAQRELGGGFDAFIRTRTPWQLAEARALIAFAAQAGLTPEGLSAAVTVPLGTVMTAAALLGELYTAEVEHNNDVAH